MGDCPRFFLERSRWESSEATLAGDEAHHASRVLRLNPGQRAEIFDGEGRACRGRIETVTGKAVRILLETSAAVDPVPLPILLAPSVPKGPAMDSIIRLATEIGATRIVPLVTDHGVVKIDDPARRRDKWQRLALEACKQCGRNWLPNVELPMRLDAFLADGIDSAELRCAAVLTPEARALSAWWKLPDPPSSVSLLTGPEGDFSGRELELLLGAGYRPLWLGPHILRADTAAAYGMSILSQNFLETC